MQPYLFPYIGYFQLINAVDEFVIYDDVNFIKQGWINRNRILLNKEPFMFSMQLSGASSFKKINEISIRKENEKILKTLFHAYKKAPFYSQSIKLIKNVLDDEETNLAKFIGHTIVKLSEYLDIKTNFIISSEIKKDNNLKSENKVIEICKILGATEYINTIGGVELYSKERFQDTGIKLEFLKPIFVEYKQFKNDFVPGLSIIDLLMFNSPDSIKKMLNKYELI